MNAGNVTRTGRANRTEVNTGDGNIEIAADNFGPILFSRSDISFSKYPKKLDFLYLSLDRTSQNNAISTHALLTRQNDGDYPGTSRPVATRVGPLAFGGKAVIFS